MYPPPRKRTPPEVIAQNERNQAMTGTRSDAAPERAAVTREQAASLGIVQLRATRATAAPTMDQYNALLTDVQQIALALNAMGAKFVLP